MKQKMPPMKQEMIITVNKGQEMGTRADFYIGSDQNAKWIGSVAWDGYEWAEEENNQLMKATTEQEFIDAVMQIKSERKDFTSPEDGWPWPCDDSSTTDYVYFFSGGASDFAVFDMEHEWPDMTDIKNVAYGERSGTIRIGVK